MELFVPLSDFLSNGPVTVHLSFTSWKLLFLVIIDYQQQISSLTVEHFILVDGGNETSI